MAQTYNIQIDQGSTYTMTVEYQDAAALPINLTGYAGRMQVRTTVDGTVVLAEFTSVPAAGIVIDGPAGTATLTITSEQTALYDFINAVYDLEVYDGAVPADVIRLIQGRFLVNKEVTR